METKVANNLKTILGDWDEYDSVFMLEQINPQAFRGGDFHQGKVRPPRDISLIHRPPRQDIQNPMNPFPGIPGGQGFHGPGENIFSPELRVNLRKGTYFRLSQIIHKPDMQRPPVFPGDDMFIPPVFFLNGQF